MNELVLKSIDDLDEAALFIKPFLESARIICFYGEMGAGKTTIIKTLCKHLGVIDIVVSPTFALINEYSTSSGETVFHFDFYRIQKLEEVYDFGYEEYFFNTKGICLIEWPELIEEILPHKGIIRLYISVLPDGCRLLKTK